MRSLLIFDPSVLPGMLFGRLGLAGVYLVLMVFATPGERAARGGSGGGSSLLPWGFVADEAVPESCEPEGRNLLCGQRVAG